MSLYNYFHPVFSLPTSQQSGLSEHGTFEANKAVEQVSEKKAGEKWKYSSFTDEDRATVGKFAAENGNTAAIKHFKVNHNVGESTVCNFNIKYIDQLEKHRKRGNASLPVTSIGTKKHGRPLTLGNFDSEVQKYVTALTLGMGGISVYSYLTVLIHKL